jgi:CRISPR-associated endonuclease Cas2
MTCIVSYDIESDKIRTKLARYLEKKGIRLQKSVFALEVERHVFRNLLRGIEHITGKRGKVAVFRLCEGCKTNAIQMNEDKKRDVYVF